jgi:filamentous hemagglutinin family protein
MKKLLTTQPMITTPHQPKPLVQAIRTLIASGLVMGVGVPQVRAELPVPIHGGPLTATPVDIASQGHATAAINANTLNIKQIDDKVTLDWKSFNIGKDNAVDINQPSTGSVSLNRIHDINPSQILGKLTANGQVYMVNQNGFVFGKDSQINVNSLVATTLNISDEVFQRGITKVFDISKSAAFEGNGQLYLKNDQGQFVLDQKGEKIKIQIFIEQGAKIYAGVNAADKTNPGSSGRVIIAAPTVTNAGTISTPDGQTILAGSQDKVYLQEAGSDSNIRGLLVEVGTGGKTTNVGKVIAERGNVSLMGFAVNQQGIASASTSVRLNGSVRLLAREGIQSPSSTGGRLLGASTVRTADNGDGLGTKATVDMAGGSLTSVDLDTDKSATAIDAQAQSPSTVELSGHNVVLHNKAVIQAKSGAVSIAAVDNPANTAIKGNARVYLEAGSKIDVSGVKNVSLPMSRNVVQVELRKNELKDSPLQRDGILYGKTVSVDLRNADISVDDSTGNVTSATVPIADIKGAVDRIARNIDERSTAGGSIALQSSGDVVTKAGSVLDFSGGSVAFKSGTVKTTELVSAGQVYDITAANPDRKYSAIITDSHFEKGYAAGKAGGSLKINAYEALLNGDLNGKTISGLWQRTPEQLARSSSLTIDLNNGNLFGRQNIVFDAKATVPDVGSDEALPRKASTGNEAIPLTLNAGLLKKAAVGQVDIKTNGTIQFAAGQTVTLKDQAELNLNSAGVEVLGSIRAPSGSISINPINLVSPSPITLGQGAKIDVSGLWVNDWVNSHQGKALDVVSIQGGTVNLTTEQADLHLQAGSKIDVSGGAWYQNNAKLQGGAGGQINLVAATHEAGGSIASLLLDGDLAGWSLTEGGRLHLSSNEVVIGSADAAGVHAGSTAKPLVLNPDFVDQGGFSSYSLNANYYGLTVAENVQLSLQQHNLKLNAKAYLKPTGSTLQAMSSVVTLPQYLRKPTDLSLSVNQLAGQNRASVLTIASGAAINGEATSNISLSADSSIYMNGTLNAPGGAINLTINTPGKGDSGFYASQSIWLGANSQLLSQGVYQPEYNGYGLKTGQVLSGGKVNLTANRGYIVSDATSVIDVSGTTSKLDIQKAVGGSSNVVATDIASEGGSISLNAGEGIVADGQFKAQGGTGAAGGSLAIDLNGGLRNKPEIPIAGGAFPDDQNVKSPRTIEIAAAQTSVISGNLSQGSAIPSAQFSGHAFINAPQLNDSGAGNLSLKLNATAGNEYTGSIIFAGDMQLSIARQIALDAPSLKTNNSQINLATNYAALGSSQSRLDTQLGLNNYTSRLAPESVAGGGQLTVEAKNIDLVGGLSFNGFGTVNLTSQGDVRTIGILGVKGTKDYLGVLNLAGDLNITASQVYPATLTDYTINLTGNSIQTLTVKNSGETANQVLSAGGRLTINADNIDQQGTIKAPFGRIALNAASNLDLASGSLTSVSGNGLTVPFGQVSGGLNWLYPIDSSGAVNIVIDTPPEKRLTITGQNIALNDGATIDLSGGGDLYAYEFIPGPGGSQNVLNPAAAGFTQKFAVMPSLGTGLTPYDPQAFAASGLNMGDSVYLSSGSGLKAGWYNLLPASYALLPSAYLVTPQTGTQDFTPGQSITALNGAAVVAGRYGDASAGIQAARWQGFAVEPGAIARTRSEFKDYTANSFFANKAKLEGSVAPQLPQDAGSLAIAVNNSLALGAKLLANPAASGLGGQVDISANKLVVVASQADVSSSPSGTVSLLDSDLNKLNAPSLMLGGLRSKEKTGQRIKVASQTLTVAGDSHLTGQEIILAAKDQVKVSSGAVIESTAKTDAEGVDLLVDNKVASASQANSDGALLRVSAAGQADITRDQKVTGTTGVLTVESGATLKATGSMTLDSTQNTKFDGAIDMTGGSLSLKSSRISLGNAPSNTPGLLLKNTDFSLDELKLTSTSDFDIYGSVGINTKQLSINAAAINGFNTAIDSVSIAADTIRLTNSVATGNRTGTGTGAISLTAKNIELGGGSYALNGFKSVNITGAESVKGLGQVIEPTAGNSSLTAPSVLKVAGDLNLSAGRLLGDNGATITIDASGHSLSLNAVPNADSTSAAGLGARLSLYADSISSTAVFDLPGGILEMAAARGNIDLNAGTSVNVAGKAIAFDNLTKAMPAGSVLLTSNTGNVNFAAGASMNLAGAAIDKQQVGSAGALTVNASQGQFNWNGTVDAGSVQQHADTLNQGQFSLDAKSFGSSGLSGLNTQLAQANLTDYVSLRQRIGDVILAATDTVKARVFSLIADQGKVTLNGVIDVSAAEAGDVSVSGRNGVMLAAGAKIDAHSTQADADGGSVYLNTVHGDDTGSGLLDLSSTGSSINVAGGANVSGGALHLRTGRGDANNSVNITAINTAITGVDTQRSYLEATRVYAGQSVINNSQIASWKNDTSNYMNAAPTVTNLSGTAINLVPGIEVRAQNDLSLATKWDLLDWRYNDASGSKTLPGFLTLNAGNNHNINASLTDAFATDSIPGQTSRVYEDMLQSGLSWSYNLIAGNNVNLASSYVPASTSQKSQVVVRTGTGSINMAAGKNITFVSDASDSTAAAAVYTMGTVGKYTRTQLLQGLVPSVPARTAGETDAQYLNRLDPALMDDLLRFGYLDETRIGNLFQKAEFPTQGGNINLRAGGNIDGINTGQKVSDWLVRSGTLADNRPTLWGINISGDRSSQTGSTPAAKGIRTFNQNVAALGGGDVSVVAGGSVSNLSVMIPTTGKPLGTVGETANQWISNNPAINGGGNLTMVAGKDIVGGEYFTGKGAANLTAGGSVANTKNGSGAIFELGDSQINVQARQDVNIAATYNPTLLKQSQLVGGESRFFTYTPDSAINFVSSAGNIIFQNSVGTTFETSVYPGTVKATAYAGDIGINSSMTLYPAANGQLQLLANNNIKSSAVAGQNVNINVSDTDISLLPNAANPAASLEGSLNDGLLRARERLDPTTPLANIVHAVTPVHQDSSNQSLMVAKQGSIGFTPGSQVTFFLPTASGFSAGLDIKNLTLSGQNLNANDVTRLQAGRNIIYNTQINNDGVVLANDNEIQLAGPGQLQVLAGRDINLGASAGVQTIGNIFNTALASSGATISLAAGLSDKVDYNAFISKYAAVKEYADLLTPLKDLPEVQQKQQLQKVLQVLFSEIKQSAASAAAAPESKRTELYQRGFDAIAALFPGDKYAGDLNFVFSQVKTLDGGDINMAAPGGKIDVGLAGQLGGISKTAAQLGVVAQQQGSVNACIRDNFNVNQSRVFTLGGGDITVWSSKGSIDAGKGAKSAIAAPPPVTTVDEKGNIVTTFPPIVSGSGIQAIGNGQVTLAAPVGIVDAGEAGISGGQIVIAATAVVGASNISSIGGSVGVPTTAAPPATPSSASSAAASAAKSATDSGKKSDDEDVNKEDNDKNKKPGVSRISTDVVGYGSCSPSDVRDNKSGCGDKAPAPQVK